MTTPINFSEYYKAISNLELLNILHNSEDYQPLAVEAARKEFSNRQLSDIEINEAKEIFLAKQLQKEKQKEKIKAIEQKVKNTSHTLVDTLNPIQSGIPTTEKIIRLIVIVFGGLFFYGVIKDFRMLQASIKDFLHYPFESSLILFPFVFMLLATVTFWKRKAIGWILLTIFLTFSAVGALWILVGSFYWESSGIAALDNLFPRPSPTEYIIQLIFLTGTLFGSSFSINVAIDPLDCRIYTFCNWYEVNKFVV